MSGSSGKSQKEGQEDQGGIQELGAISYLKVACALEYLIRPSKDLRGPQCRYKALNVLIQWPYDALWRVLKGLIGHSKSL